MGHDGFRYEFTGKEFIYLAFKRKTCPNCKGKLIKIDTHEIVKGETLNKKSDAFFVPNANIKLHKIAYKCDDCKRVFELSKLAN